MTRFDNPVLTKEMRTRMRGTRAYWLLFFYVMLCSLFLFVAYLSWHNRYASGGFTLTPGTTAAGRQLFQMLFVAQAAMISLIVPALTAGMLTIEREQRTFELLLLTVLPPRQIIGGKVGSAFGFAALLLTASLPLAGICFLLGGISPLEIAIVYLLLAMSALTYAAIGIFFSALLRSTAVATATTYMAALFLAAATGAAGGGGRAVLFSAVSPIAAVFNALHAAPFFRWHVPTWIAALLLNAAIAALAAAGAVHRLEEGVSERPTLLRWLTLVLFALLALGITGNVFGSGTTSASQVRAALAWLSGALLIALAALSVIFCTGDAPEVRGAGRASGGARKGLSRLLEVRPFAGGYATGPAYIALLFLFGAAILASGIVLAPATTRAMSPETLGAALLVALAGVAFCVALSRLYSVLTGSRYTAAAVLFVTVTALLLFPLFSYVGWDSSLNPAHRLIWETLYLNPVIAFLAVALNPGDWAKTVPALWAGQEGAWVVTVFLYLAAAVVLEGVGRAILARSRK
ncbi:MAG: hypothetical protein HY321_21355 [Armatimonadetes bacterium]|nr:hypothetical protein [Armatimonadota bacterium]